MFLGIRQYITLRRERARLEDRAAHILITECPELAWSWVLRHVAGISIENLRLICKRESFSAD